MSANGTLTELAQAEFEARRTVARVEAEEAEARAASVVRKDLGLVAPAGYWANVGWWSLRLSEPDEAWPALRRSLEWELRWIEHVWTIAPPHERAAWKWQTVLGHAIMARDTAAERMVLALPVDVGGGRRRTSGLGYIAALRALALADDVSAIEAARFLDGLPDERVRKEQFYPRLGAVVRAILAGDSHVLRAELDAICAQHVVFATRGHLRLSEAGLQCLPATCLAILARRRGMDVDVDERYHAVRLKLPVTVIQEWHGEPVRGLIVEGTFDIVPRALPPDIGPVSVMAGSDMRGATHESAAQAIEPTRAQAPDSGRREVVPDAPAQPARARVRRDRPPRQPVPDVDESVVRLELQLREAQGGATWQLASWALMLGDPVRARLHLVRRAAEAERYWRGSFGFRDDDPAVPAELRGFPNHNFVRDHFALALVIGDERAVAETARQLNEWERAILRVRQDDQLRYGVAYLDLIRDLLTPEAERPGRRSDVELAQVARGFGWYRYMWYTCVALVERDSDRFNRGLAEILAEYARQLHHKVGPPPPICEEAVHLAVAARRLGLPITVGGIHRDYPVPIRIMSQAEHRDKVGVLRCDMLGMVLWGPAEAGRPGG